MYFNGAQACILGFYVQTGFSLVVVNCIIKIIHRNLNYAECVAVRAGVTSSLTRCDWALHYVAPE